VLPAESVTFRLGINYWPIRRAMAMWKHLDPTETAEDFARIAEGGFDCVRVFLLWEDFQPEPAR
jgi:endo-1,4-beta-mannosidase